MKHRIVPALMICCVLALAGVIVSSTNKSVAKPDLVELNRIKINVDNADNFSDFSFNSKYGFTVVSAPDGNVLYSTAATENMPLTERVNRAVTNYDNVFDYEPDGVKGKIIIYTGALINEGRNARNAVSAAAIAGLTLLIGFYYYYMRVRLYGPFKRLKGYAANIAAGNLETALPMDKGNLLGEFTESFDIMREELKAAKQKALDEERSKKELIASLSHDIKTPVSIVRAASELLEIAETDGKKLSNIKAIQAKALEIDMLITDLFSSALEDLSELKIEVKDIESSLVEAAADGADPLKKISIMSKMPACLIKADALRLGQIFGNIISNSYKYAGTKIEVTFAVIDRYLRISFKDFGMSLGKDELPLLINKFFRGKNSDGKQGAGLGLYICSQILGRMGGSLDFDLEKDGLRVDVSLALS